MSAKGPNLKSYLEKEVLIHLNKGRKVSGILRGFDQFMNVVLDEAADETADESERNIGTIAVRGNSIVEFQLLAR